MLASIILFLALILAIVGICSIIVECIDSLVYKLNIDLTKSVIFLIISAALFSIFCYLTH